MMFTKRCKPAIGLALRAMLVVALGTVGNIPAFSQVTGATLSGLVKDTSGAIVPNASISIKNSATGETREVTTNASGFYSAPNLLPGNYDVAVTATGFTRVAQTGVTLSVGAQQELNFNLTVGAMNQTGPPPPPPPHLPTPPSTILPTPHL